MNFALRRLDDSSGCLAGVLHEYPDPRHVALGPNQPALEGKGPHPGEDVAAVLAVIHPWLVHYDLGKQIVDIDPGTLRATNDRHFTGQRIRTTDTIDLPRVGRAHGGE
ncbi:hypothetical protein D3C87_1745470 [compost metagenome]